MTFIGSFDRGSLGTRLGQTAGAFAQPIAEQFSETFKESFTEARDRESLSTGLKNMQSNIDKRIELNNPMTELELYQDAYKIRGMTPDKIKSVMPQLQEYAKIKIEKERYSDKQFDQAKDSKGQPYSKGQVNEFDEFLDVDARLKEPPVITEDQRRKMISDESLVTGNYDEAVKRVDNRIATQKSNYNQLGDRIGRGQQYFQNQILKEQKIESFDELPDPINSGRFIRKLEQSLNQELAANPRANPETIAGRYIKYVDKYVKGLNSIQNDFNMGLIGKKPEAALRSFRSLAKDANMVGGGNELADYYASQLGVSDGQSHLLASGSLQSPEMTKYINDLPKVWAQKTSEIAQNYDKIADDIGTKIAPNDDILSIGAQLQQKNLPAEEILTVLQDKFFNGEIDLTLQQEEQLNNAISRGFLQDATDFYFRNIVGYDYQSSFPTTKESKKEVQPLKANNKDLSTGEKFREYMLQQR